MDSNVICLLTTTSGHIQTKPIDGFHQTILKDIKSHGIENER
jgi:hypothetical protein